jgi:hypothetical protein
MFSPFRLSRHHSEMRAQNQVHGEPFARKDGVPLLCTRFSSLRHPNGMLETCFNIFIFLLIPNN